MTLKDVYIFHDHLLFCQRIHLIIILVQSCSTPKCWWSVEDELVVVWWCGSRVKWTRHLISITDAQQMGTSDDVGSLNPPAAELSGFWCSPSGCFLFFLCKSAMNLASHSQDSSTSRAFIYFIYVVLLVFLPVWWMCNDHDIFSVAFISAIHMQLSHVRESVWGSSSSDFDHRTAIDALKWLCFFLVNPASIW